MFTKSAVSRLRSAGVKVVFGIVFAFIVGGLLTVPAWGTEHGGSVYPVGVDTAMPGIVPGPNGSSLSEFTLVYAANQTVNSQGQRAPGEFKLRAVGNALKLAHNWDVPLFGGRLNSVIAIPTLYEQLHVAPGRFTKSELGNVVLGVAQVGYARGPWHWYYEGDVFLPGGGYVKNDILNIGQHNFATAPAFGATYLPLKGRLEASTKMLYIVNFRDAATNYRSGNEYVADYDAMSAVSHSVTLGVNGYFYRQTTDDIQNRVVVGDGNRGRNLAVGPQAEIRLPGHAGMAVKYTRDTLVENRLRGNSFWFQIVVPLHIGVLGR